MAPTLLGAHSAITIFLLQVLPGNMNNRKSTIEKGIIDYEKLNELLWIRLVEVTSSNNDFNQQTAQLIQCIQRATTDAQCVSGSDSAQISLH